MGRLLGNTQEDCSVPWGRFLSRVVWLLLGATAVPEVEREAPQLCQGALGDESGLASSQGGAIAPGVNRVPGLEKELWSCMPALASAASQ